MANQIETVMKPEAGIHPNGWGVVPGTLYLTSYKPRSSTGYTIFDELYEPRGSWDHHHPHRNGGVHKAELAVVRRVLVHHLEEGVHMLIPLSVEAQAQTQTRGSS